MGKKKTSKKQNPYLEKLAKLDLDKIPGLSKIDPLKMLCDPDLTARAIMECLQGNDPDGVMEIVADYLEALDKVKLRKHSKLKKSTMYAALKHRNPTIKTLAKIMHIPKKTTAKRSARRTARGGSYTVKGAIAASGK